MLHKMSLQISDQLVISNKLLIIYVAVHGTSTKLTTESAILNLETKNGKIFSLRQTHRP